MICPECNRYYEHGDRGRCYICYLKLLQEERESHKTEVERRLNENAKDHLYRRLGGGDNATNIKP